MPRRARCRRGGRSLSFAERIGGPGRGGRNERASWHGMDGPARPADLAWVACPDCQHEELTGDLRRFPATVASLEKGGQRTCATCRGRGEIRVPGRRDAMLEPPARGSS